MKTTKEQKDQFFRFTSTETEKLTFLISELDNLIENPEISEQTLATLVNMSREVDLLREQLTLRIIKLCKQGEMVD